MRVVQAIETPSTWRLGRLVMPDGRVGYHTGDASESGWQIQQYRNRDIVVDFGPNVVVEGALRLDRQEAGVFYFSDDNQRVTYQATAAAACEIFQCVQDGRLRAERGRIVGRFSFRSQNGHISICAHIEAPLPEGAPPAGRRALAAAPPVRA